MLSSFIIFINGLLTLFLGILIICTRNGTWWGVLATILCILGLAGVLQSDKDF